jgi:RNA polymerase sigma factor (sigma-70 family)
MLNPDDAADLAQEAMLRVVTRIGQFEGRSSFRTWAYRIVANAFLDARKGRLEALELSFDAYGAELDRLGFEALTLPAHLEAERRVIVEEAKLGCMLGMLLCLSREQRLVYLLGEVCEAPSDVAAAILDISPANFRKRLERARADLVAFMNDRCGLMDPANPCRCERKTAAFIREGWVDPVRRKFAAPHLGAVRAELPQASMALAAVAERADATHRAATLFRSHPLYDGADGTPQGGPDLAAVLRTALDGPEVRRALRLAE